jgi:hypothetical protein
MNLGIAMQLIGSVVSILGIIVSMGSVSILGIIVVMVGIVLSPQDNLYTYMKQKISGDGNAVSNGVEVSNNVGNTFVPVNSPGSQQNVNNKRYILPEAKIEKKQEDGVYAIYVTLNQTDGFWNDGTPFILQAKLDGSYAKYDFVSGIPKVLTLSTSTLFKEAANKEKGEIFFKTLSAPFNEPIVLKIESEQDVNIISMEVLPQKETIT